MATMPIRLSHNLPMVPSRLSEERGVGWAIFGAATFGLGGTCSGSGIGGGGVGVAWRAVSSRDTVIGGCSGVLVIAGGVAAASVTWGWVLADCSSR